MSAPVTRRQRLAVMLVLAATPVAGCGGGAVGREQHAQQDALRYEQRLGQINTAAAAPSVSPQETRDRLAATVKAYATLQPPALLRPVHRRVLRALRDELRSVKDGLRATAAGDGAGIRSAQARGARSRAAVARALRQVATQVGRCRASLPACVPPVAPGRDG